ncbi:AAA family ATPase [Duodenibacillus massiliensis]|uniref:AAA family ATPase n=1 Tax=Duodenibacillus massiliensis TaxID=1852381 RepID=UPI00307C30B6
MHYWVFRWLTDITFDADTSDIVGFTRKDLETTFLPWVQRAAQTTGLTPVDVMDRLEARYGGWRFSFEEKPPVLCPWMVNSYLRDPHERVVVDWQCYGRQRTVVLKYRDIRLERYMLTLTDTIRLTEFPAGSPGLEPREECGLSKFFNFGPNAAKPCT